MFMSKRTVIAVSAAGLAVVLLLLGVVLQNQADFSHHYVRTQLTEHQITFVPVANLLPAQKKQPCLVANAGKQLTTGKQAECYALQQIGIDLTMIDSGRGYSQDHYAAYLLRTKAQAALKAAPNAPATKALMKQSAVLDAKAEALFDGETMRGLLLSAYGFSLLGDRAGQAAVVCFVAAALFLLVTLGTLSSVALSRAGARAPSAATANPQLSAA
jgi:hypothetical protein